MIKKHPPVTIITGENGTGKTIILDAIRGMLGINHFQLERNIVRNSNKFSVQVKSTFITYRIPHISAEFKNNIFIGNENLMGNYFTNDIEPVKDLLFKSILTQS